MIPNLYVFVPTVIVIPTILVGDVFTCSAMLLTNSVMELVTVVQPETPVPIIVIPMLCFAVPYELALKIRRVDN